MIGSVGLMGLLLALADPPALAPAVPSSPAPSRPLAPPPFLAGLAVGLGYRPAGELSPPFGVAASAVFGRRYALVRGRMSLSLGASLAYERFAGRHETSHPSETGELVTLRGAQSVSVLEATALHVIGWERWPVRPWFGYGGGVSAGWFESPDPRHQPRQLRTVRPALRTAAGIDLPLEGAWVLGLRFEHAHLLGAPVITADDGRRLDAFGTRLSLRLALQRRF